MVRPAQTARSERTREALRQAALVRFLAQGVEDTSAEQIAADAGVSLRTFYRHFASKHDLLFADYDAGLHWFRAALATRTSRRVDHRFGAARRSWRGRMTIGPLRRSPRCAPRRLDPGRIVRHIRQVEADFAEAIEEHLTGEDPPEPGTDERMQITVTARCIAAAVFGAMEVWMLGEERSLPELARLSPGGAGDAAETGSAESFVIIDKTSAACQPQPMADFDAIVVGAGHNGLTAAALLQKAGLRTLCLDSKLYAGGMASTVELFDGFKFEIAGSVQIPTVGRWSAANSDSTSCRPSTST